MDCDLAGARLFFPGSAASARVASGFPVLCGVRTQALQCSDLRLVWFDSQKAITGITDIELKVKEACNDDAWGASSTLMKEIARATFN